MNEIDVKRLIGELTDDEIAQSAEEYFRAVDERQILRKPFVEASEAAILLLRASLLLQAARPLPGMHVVDYGAGTCWFSRWLSELGCAVTAVDLSPTALQLGERLYQRHAPFGAAPAPQFVVLRDGRMADVADGSQDRVLVMDAFHHVRDQALALAEFARVLKPDGVVALAEPGPEHSLSPQSQAEMRQHRVIENDIVVEEIWDLAAAAGFCSIRVAIFDPEPAFVPLEEFNGYLAGDPGCRERAAASTARRLRYHRVILLEKGEPLRRDSRDARGLVAQIEIALAPRHTAGAMMPVRAVVTNTSSSDWLPHAAGVGGIGFGVFLIESTDGRSRECLRLPLSDRVIPPGGSCPIEFALPAPPPGTWTFEFDLVAEHVTWFHLLGSPVPRIEVVVEDRPEDPAAYAADRVS